MRRLSANLSTMFCEVPLRERFACAADAGFAAVEIQYPYDETVAQLAWQLRKWDLSLVLINAPLGEEPGRRGLACVPDRVQEFREQFDNGLEYAAGLGCRFMHVLSGTVTDDMRRISARETWLQNLAWAAELAGQANITLVVEVLNPADVPRYFLRSIDEAVSLIDQVGSENLRLLFDTYHCAMSGGDCATEFQRAAGYVAHVQVADVPGRNEPGSGRIDWAGFMTTLKTCGYGGYIGCEYRSAPEPGHSLDWVNRFQVPDIPGRPGSAALV